MCYMDTVDMKILHTLAKIVCFVMWINKPR